MLSSRFIISLSLVLPFTFGLIGEAAPPKVAYIFPAGAGRGQSVEVTASLESTAWPLQTWIDRPGVTIAAEKDKGKFKFSVDKDAVPGTYWFRLFGTEGATTLRPFIVGTLNELEEKEPNDSPEKSQIVEKSVTINGRLTKADVDGFAVQLKEGETLVASVTANSELGSPMDTVMQVCSLTESASSNAKAAKGTPQFKEAFVLEQNDDSMGLDPLIVLKAPRDGWYLVRLFAFPVETNSSISFAGAENFIYRLTITTGGFLDHTLPLAISRDQPTELALSGWNINSKQLLWPSPLKNISTNEAKNGVPAFVNVFHEDLAAALRLPVVEHPNILAEGSRGTGEAQQVVSPITITGRLEMPKARDTFRFQATKGQRIRIKAESRALGFPLDPLITVTNAQSKTLMEADDLDKTQRDSETVFAAPATGEYRVSIRDAHQHGGPRYVYRLTIAEVKPDYTLSVAADAFIIEPKKDLEIPVTITRKDNFNQAVDIAVEGLPAGARTETVESKPTGDSAKSVKLVIKQDSDTTAPFSGVIRIIGKTKAEGSLPHPASFAPASPSTPNAEIWLTVQK